jgi:HPt (histidine-containing phosphotransfer) domain-containing protein
MQDHAGAAHLVHTLRSVAGIVGATVLQTSAQALETQLHLKPVHTEQTYALLAALDGHLNHLVQALQALPGFEPTAPTASNPHGAATTISAQEVLP